MLPWEHVAFGYLGYSLYRHVRHGGAPRDGAAIAAVTAAIAPDLVDKPLSWAVGLFPTGYAVGHSVFTFAAIVAAAAAVRRREGGELAGAVVVGWGTHLLGDVLYPVLFDRGVAVERVLWPLVTLSPYENRLGLLARTLLYLQRHAARVLSGEVSTAVAVQVGLVLLVALLWLYDGAPGVRFLIATSGSSDRR